MIFFWELTAVAMLPLGFLAGHLIRPEQLVAFITMDSERAIITTD